MKTKIIKFSDIIKHPRKRHSKREKEKHTCTDCQRLYIKDMMIPYRRSNYLYYEENETWFCIRCYNKRFN